MKVEISDDYIRIENPRYSGEGKDLRVIDLQENAGIKAVLCVETKRIKTYLFDKDIWTVEDSKEWVKENAKDLSSAETKAEVEITEKGKIIAVASEEVPDRDGEILSSDGWKLDNFKKNPVLLWMHNRAMGHSGLPIGSVKSIKVSTIGGQKKLVFEPEFDESNEFNRTVSKFYKDGVMNAFSVGFIPLERDGDTYTKQELLEISAVPVPALQSALVISRGKAMGISKEKSMEILEHKGAVKYRAYQPAEESKSWNGTTAKSRVRKFAGGPDKEEINWNEYKEAFAWFDDMDEKNYGAYKLPHHDVVGKSLVTVWKGVVSAMASLMGARGGVELPESDRKAVYNHLAKHYEQFDKVAPDYKLIESQELKGMFDVIGELNEKDNLKFMKKVVVEVKQAMADRKTEEREDTIVGSELVDALKTINKSTNIALSKIKGSDSLGKEDK